MSKTGFGWEKLLVMSQNIGRESYEKTAGVTPSTRKCSHCGLDVSATQSTCPVDGTPLESTYSPGATLDGKYEFIQLIGAGGMGVVYKARQIILNKVVAIKMLHTEMINERALKRFQREGKAAAVLSHPNIIKVYDFAISQHGQPYMVMDFVQGQTLEDKISADGCLEIEFTVDAMLQICDALSHAHKHGVLHRDMKPSNVLIIENEGKPPSMLILDFGIAKITDNEKATVNLTQTGDTLGSPLYMSPEQCAGKEMDRRTELYHLGCTMYECLTGLPPFVGNTIAQIIAKITLEPPPPLKDSSLGKEFPPALEEIVMKLLNKNPDDRYQSVDELKWVLEMYKEGEPAVPAPVRIDVSELPPEKSKSAKTIAIASAVACAVALVLVWFTIQHLTKQIPQTVKPVLPARVAAPSGTADGIEPSKPVDTAKAVRDFVDKNPMTSNIDMGYWEIKDSDMAPLAEETGCLELNLPGNSIHGEGLKYIEPLTKLTSLRLDRNDLVDAGLEHLRNKKSLVRLNLNQTKVGGSGLSHLKDCPLVFLDMSHNKLDHKGLSSLKSLANVASIKFDDTSFNDECATYLTGMRNLKVLDLSHTHVTDAGIAEISKLDGVRELWLVGCDIDDRCMSSISHMKGLVRLDISGTRITGDGMRQLANSKSLMAVYCAACQGNIMGAYDEIKKHLPACSLIPTTHRG